jgi:hypothetical protein
MAWVKLGEFDRMSVWAGVPLVSGGGESEVPDPELVADADGLSGCSAVLRVVLEIPASGGQSAPV